MDRNLGALTNDGVGTTDRLYYQFGRKDPFRAIAHAGVSLPGNVSTQRLQAIPATLANPLTIYNATQWEIENSSLWSTVNSKSKTVLDPCPEGWRVPVQTTASNSPWGGLTTYTTLTSALGYYPLCGYINNGAAPPANGSAYYWTSNGMGLNVTSSNLTNNAPISRQYAVSVRCVVDVSYIKKGGQRFRNGSSLMDEIKP